MNSSQRLLVLLLATISVYFSISTLIFEEVFRTIPVVVDELFHVPQGVAYCNKNYSYWDPKITTLPGLYLVSSAVLGLWGSYFECNLYNLRSINLIASCVNLVLLVSILKYVYFIEIRKSKIVLQALSLTILPPLYFFSHVYYTDTLSLTFLLAFSRICFTSKYKSLMLAFGFLSVLMRQTNIAWIAMVFGHKTLDILIKSSRVFGNQYITNVKLSKNSLIARDMDNSKLKRYYSLSDVYVALKYHFRTYFTTFFKFLSLQDWLVLITHSILLVSFVVFVYLNGSIVVGDKKAHTASLHIPQLLYFLLFYGVFGLPYVLFKIPSTIELMVKNKLNILLLALAMAVIVHFNTIIHPYLLADNRHFTFYVWNRWFGKFDFAIYTTIPLYIFLLFSLYDNLKDQNCISFLLPFCICLFLVLGLQAMIEIRYFLIPYIILRLRFIRPSYDMVLFEFIWYVTLNACAFYVFFSKEVIWADFDYAQRIIW